MVNEHEGVLALELLGGSARHDGDREDHAVVSGLVAAGVPSVVLTRGARGALVATPGSTVAVSSPAVAVVDTTGAGDAFVGALATRLLVGEPLVDAAAFAARVGAFACTGRGAQPSYPWSGDPLPG